MFDVFRKNLTVKRTTEGAFVNGFWVEGAEDEITIKASVQPLSGQDLELLPEGKRLGGGYRLFTNDELIVAVEGSNQNGDIVLIGGFEYEVASQEIWNNNIINHNVYTCLKV